MSIADLAQLKLPRRMHGTVRLRYVNANPPSFEFSRGFQEAVGAETVLALTRWLREDQAAFERWFGDPATWVDDKERDAALAAKAPSTARTQFAPLPRQQDFTRCVVLLRTGEDYTVRVTTDAERCRRRLAARRGAEVCVEHTLSAIDPHERVRRLGLELGKPRLNQEWQRLSPSDVAYVKSL